MDQTIKEDLQNKSAKYLTDLFKNHDIDGNLQGNKIIFAKEQISIETYCSDQTANSDLVVVQLDVCISYGIKDILESFVGFGADFDTANKNAFENFTHNAFHTILAAFFTTKFDDQIQKYNWEIGGKEFEVFSSNIGIRGTTPTDLTTEWLDEFETEVKKLPLETGTHWIRLFYAQQQHATTVCEILLDNDNCRQIHEKANEFKWHYGEAFYSVRVFMILKNGIDFGRIVKLIGSEQEYKDVFSSLTQIGLSELEIEKAYAFIPEAFGRKLIQDMGISGTFPKEATVINNKKRQFQIGLNEDEIYQKATRLVNELTENGWSENLKQIAIMSASFDVLNNALQDSIPLEDIDCSLFSVMFHIPTYTQISTNNHLKPFWKFW